MSAYPPPSGQFHLWAISIDFADAFARQYGVRYRVYRVRNRWAFDPIPEAAAA